MTRRQTKKKQSDLCQRASDLCDAVADTERRLGPAHRAAEAMRKEQAASQADHGKEIKSLLQKQYRTGLTHRRDQEDFFDLVYRQAKAIKSIMRREQNAERPRWTIGKIKSGNAAALVCFREDDKAREACTLICRAVFFEMVQYFYSIPLPAEHLRSVIEKQFNNLTAQELPRMHDEVRPKVTFVFPNADQSIQVLNPATDDLLVALASGKPADWTRAYIQKTLAASGLSARGRPKRGN